MIRLLLILAAGLGAFEAERDFTKEELRSIFYADLGPEDIDVSSYPEKQKENYQVFLRACSRCHTPARALFSATSTRQGWKEYSRRMKGQARLEKVALSEEEIQAVVEFLAFDGQRRKVEGRAQFERETLDLQLRFWDTIEERMRRLQQGPGVFPKKPR